MKLGKLQSSSLVPVQVAVRRDKGYITAISLSEEGSLDLCSVSTEAGKFVNFRLFFDSISVQRIRLR